MPLLGSVTHPPSLPSHGAFSGHETFAFRYAWLKKGVDRLAQRKDAFLREEAMVELGVGKNMVRSIRHWCLATQVAEEGDYLSGTRARSMRPSKLGRRLFLDPGWDPYLEDDGSLWLLHWHLATNPERATTWYWAFNVLKEQDFTRETLLAALVRVVEEHYSGRIAASSMKEDISCFLRTYVSGKRGATSTPEETLDCPLTNLSLIMETGESNGFRFNNGPKPGLPLSIFVYALVDTWDKRHRGQDTLSLREIVHGHGSPGRIFRLDDDSVLSYLDEIGGLTHGCLSFIDTAMVRQVARRGAISKEEVLDAYYAE
jgi:hypothetical protein